MRGTFFDVIPKFYILPRDRNELMQYAAAHPEQLYIQKVKPAIALLLMLILHHKIMMDVF